MRHALPLVAIVLSSVSMFGCQGGSPTAPVDSATAVNDAGIGQTLVSNAARLGALGLYDVSLDPNSLSATVTLRETRHAQENHDIYLLSIDGFLRPDSFRLLTIARMPDPSFIGGSWDVPRLELLWEFTHPFASSGTIPRADLGFTGIACFLFDVDSATGHSYFTGDSDVILNESLVIEADGYFQPKALLDLSGYTANTFPYQKLADEGRGDAGQGNRFLAGTVTPVGNGGNPRGNFGPDGWQTGASDTWTGYDVLHQGQSVRRKLYLDLAAVEAAGSLDFTVAIFDKYVDPKSATPGFEHRLPADPPDVLGDFGYRYPHGCWDVSHVDAIGETRGLIADKESVTTLRLKVRDWDARAEPSGEADLSLEADPAEILASGLGTPSLRVCVPAAHGGPAGFAPFESTPVDDDTIIGFYGDEAPDSGRPYDELFYVGNIYAPDGAPGTTGGSTWGVIEVADVEADLPVYETVLDGDLTPITTDLPRNVTYQVFQLAVQDASAAAGWAASGHGDGDSYATSVVYDNAGNVFTGGTFTGTINLGGADYVSNGNTDCYVAKYDENGAFQWASTWGGTGADEVTCLLISEDNPLNLLIGGSFSDTVNFDPPSGSPRTADFIDMYVLQVLATNGSFASVRTYGSPGFDVVTSLADSGNRPEADYVLGGYIQGETDFGGGFTLTPLTSIQGVVVGLDRITGNAKSAYVLDSTDYSTVTDVALFEDGQVAAAGVFAGTLLSAAGSKDSRGSSDGYCMRITLSTTAGMSTENFLSSTGGAEADSIGGLLAFGSGATASVIIASNTQDAEGDYAGVVAHLTMTPSLPFGFERIESTGYYQINSLAAVPFSSPDAGTFYATGVKSGRLYFYAAGGPDPVVLPGTPDTIETLDTFVWKFTSPDPDSVYFRTVWAREFGGIGSETGYAIAARDDAAAIAGVYNSLFDIAPGPQTANLPLLGLGESFVTQLPADGSW